MSIYYNRQEAADYLRVSISTIDRMARTGTLSRTVIGRRVLFTREALAALGGRTVVVTPAQRRVRQAPSAHLSDAAVMGRRELP